MQGVIGAPYRAAMLWVMREGMECATLDMVALLTVPEHTREDRSMEEAVKGQAGMMTQAQLEERLLAVETALKEIQHRLATLPPAPNWLAEVIGSFKDEPAFDEVMAFGRAFRESEPYPDDPGAPA
jgi:hypothetical protein